MSPSVTLPCGEEGRGVGRTTVGGRGVPRKTGPRLLCAAAKCSAQTPSSPRPRRHAGTRLIIQYCSVARVKVTQLLSGILELDPDPGRVVPGHPRTGMSTSAHGLAGRPPKPWASAPALCLRRPDGAPREALAVSLQ